MSPEQTDEAVEMVKAERERFVAVLKGRDDHIDSLKIQLREAEFRAEEQLRQNDILREVGLEALHEAEERAEQHLHTMNELQLDKSELQIALRHAFGLDTKTPTMAAQYLREKYPEALKLVQTGG